MMYQTIKLTNRSQKFSSPFTRSLRLTTGTLPQAIPQPAWGIDPGVNFGLTIIEQDKVYVFHGTLQKEDAPGCYGLAAFRFLTHMIRLEQYLRLEPGLMTIEGAAYGYSSTKGEDGKNIFQSRQIELSEIRTGFYLAASTADAIFSDVVIRAPATIRKLVFGHGRTQAGNEWPLLNHNAADSLSMALYSAQYTEE